MATPDGLARSTVMNSLWSEMMRRARARPRTLMLVGSLLLAVGFAGGWVGANRLVGEHASYTKGRREPVPDRPAPPAPAGLQAELEAIAARYREPVGLAVTDVTEGWTAQVAGDEPFPQQSVSKLWVAIAVLQAVDEGALALDQWVVMRPEDRSVFYQPLASRIRGPDGLAITLSDLLRWALTESDNSANDKLIREVGGAGVVTATIADKGLRGVAVGGTERDLQTRTAGLQWRPEYGHTWIFKQARAELPDSVRDAALATYLANPPDAATPAGITRALASLKRGELLSRASTDYMLDLMAQAKTGVTRLKGGLAPGWTLAHKTGTGPDWRGASVGINDVGLLTAPDGHTYAVAAMIRQTSASPAARHRFMHSVTRAVMAHWEAGRAAPMAGQQVAAGPAIVAP
jgi:beta-lactamase class A